MKPEVILLGVQLPLRVRGGLDPEPPMDTKFHGHSGPLHGPLCPWFHTCGFNHQQIINIGHD